MLFKKLFKGLARTREKLASGIKELFSLNRDLDEITAEGVRDFNGRYDEYLARAGADHLDAQEVLRKARESKKAARKKGA